GSGSEGRCIVWGGGAAPVVARSKCALLTPQSACAPRSLGAHCGAERARVASRHRVGWFPGVRAKDSVVGTRLDGASKNDVLGPGQVNVLPSLCLDVAWRRSA